MAIINGSPGPDVLHDQLGADSLSGLGGNDTIILDYDGRLDSVSGGEGDDEIDASSSGGPNVLSGDDGNDTIFGSAGDDTIDGGVGNDTLYGGSSEYLGNGGLDENRNLLIGGDGTDTARFNWLLGAYEIHASGSDVIVTDLRMVGATGPFAPNPDGTSTLRGIEFVDFDGTVLALPEDLGPIVGGASADSLAGTFISDTIRGAAGDDTLAGMRGNDTLIGGDGNDVIDDDLGPNLVLGQGGNDSITAVGRIDGGFGDDVIVALANDYTGDAPGGDYEGSNRSTVFGGEGNDTITAVSGQLGFLDPPFLLDGGGGDDSILGSNTVDRINAGSGNDTIQGGDDQAYGGTNAAGPFPVGDTINGGDGIDLITGGTGFDVIDGGEGVDTAVYAGARARYEITHGAGDTIVVFDLSQGGFGSPPSDDTDSLRNIEFLRFGDGTISIVDAFPQNGGTGGPDTLVGTAGADTLSGEAGNDRLRGLGGDDDLRGGAGDDDIASGEGNDTVTAGIGQDTVVGGTGNERIDGGAGDDVVFGQTGEDTLLGGTGADRLSGDDGDDRLLGQDGADTLSGGGGSDSLDGGLGNDRINAGAGADTVRGGAGADTLTGGADADVFVFGAGDAQGDVITDFGIGVDRLSLAGAGISGEDAALAAGSDVAGGFSIATDSGTLLLAGVHAVDLMGVDFVL